MTARVVGGIATFSNLLDQLAETISINFTSGNLTEATSTNIVVSPAAATKLVIAQQPPATTAAGQLFSPQPVVMEEDQYGNVITGDSTHTVTAARGSAGTASLQGSNLTIMLFAGVATFTGLSYDKAETMNIGFTTNASGVSAAASSNIVVSPAAASQLVIEQQPSPTATIGLPFSTQPVIYEEDQYNNLKNGDNSTVVTAALNSGPGPLAGTTTAAVAGGIAKFTDLSDSTAETIKLKFTSSTLESSPSNAVVVSLGAPSKLVIATQPSATATAGQAFAVQPVIDVKDHDGNIETNDNSTVVSVALASGDGLPEGTTSVTVKNGVATFVGLNETTGGTIALEFSGDGMTTGPSTNIIVSPAAPFRLAIQTQPSSTATASQPFETQPVIDELDQYGNLETSDNSTIITASLSFGVGPLLGTATATVVGGAATFTNLSDNLVGTISLGFSSRGLSVGPSDNIVISPGAAAQLKIATQPFASVTAGNKLTDPIVIDVEDANGNIVTGDNSTVVTASLGTGAGTLMGITTATVVNGVASFNDLEDNTAGTLSLKFASGNLAPVISNPSVISPALASSIKVISGPPSGVGEGALFGLIADALDPYGNLATSFNASVTISPASGSASALSGTTTVTAVDGVATFSGLAINNGGNGYSLRVSGQGLASVTTTPFNISLTPTINGEQAAKVKLKNKKGKPTGKKALEFALTYSTSMNPALAGLASNYQVETAIIKGGKKKTTTFKRVAFKESYSQATDTVTLTIAGNQPFISGGKIVVNAAPPNGVAGATGVPLAASDTDLIIATKAKSIAVG